MGMYQAWSGRYHSRDSHRDIHTDLHNYVVISQTGPDPEPDV